MDPIGVTGRGQLLFIAITNSYELVPNSSCLHTFDGKRSGNERGTSDDVRLALRILFCSSIFLLKVSMTNQKLTTCVYSCTQSPTSYLQHFSHGDVPELHNIMLTSPRNMEHNDKPIKYMSKM